MNSEDTDVGRNYDLRFAILVDTHFGARTFAILLISGDNVAIVAAWHAREQFDIHVGRFVVECDETACATAEGNLIFAVVPEIDDGRIVNDILETNHIPNGGPTMLAHPTIFALAVCINFR